MKKPLSKASSVRHINVAHATGPAGKAKTKTQAERTRSKLVHQFNAKLGWTTESETKMISNIQNNMLRRARVDNPAASKGRSQKMPRSKSTQLDEYGSGPVVEHCVIPPGDLDSARLERAYEDELVLMNKRSSYRSDTAVGFVPVAPHLKK